MTIHYHGADIWPLDAFYAMAGKHFCVSHAYPSHVARAHQIGQSVLLDNGAFSKWKSDRDTDWPAFYGWCEPWLQHPTTWAIIPDVIDGGGQLQDALMREWPFGHRGAPVWHMDENIDRLLRLLDGWPRVCIGSTGEFAEILTDDWRQRMDECWNAIAARHRLTPWVHMLRGMQLCEHGWPFASVDSTDVAQNHSRPRRRLRKEGEADERAGQGSLVEAGVPIHFSRVRADRWDGAQTPGGWTPPGAAVEDQLLGLVMP